MPDTVLYKQNHRSSSPQPSEIGVIITLIEQIRKLRVCPGRLSNLPEITQPVNGTIEFKPTLAEGRPPALKQDICQCLCRCRHLCPPHVVDPFWRSEMNIAGF